MSEYLIEPEQALRWYRRSAVPQALNLSTVDVIEWTPNLGLRPRSATVEHIYRALKNKHPALAVYKREDILSHLHCRASNRIPPIVALADDGWMITTRRTVPKFSSSPAVVTITAHRTSESVRMPRLNRSITSSVS